MTPDLPGRIDPKQAPKSAASRVFEILSGREHQAATGATAIELIYDLLRIDPSVIEAIDFARVTGVDEMARFLIEAQRVHAMAGKSLEGAVSNLQGYVAERMVAHHLLAMGADVHFPETSNFPGIDLFVNEKAYQVKCLANPEGIVHHFSRYPDIPVYCNEELAGYFADNPMVKAVPGLYHDQVRQITTHSLDAGVDALNLEIPIISLAISAAKGGLALLSGRTDFAGAVQACVTEGATRMIFAAAGKAAAPLALAAFSVAGGWPLVIAPFFTTAIGYRLSKPAADWLKRNVLSRNAADGLSTATQSYLADAAVSVDRAIVRLEEKRRRITAALFAAGGVARESISGVESQFRNDLNTKVLIRDDLRRGISNPAHLERIYPANGVDRLLIRSSTAMRLVAAAGIFPENIGANHENLVEAAKRYDSRLKRLLVTR